MRRDAKDIEDYVTTKVKSVGTKLCRDLEIPGWCLDYCVYHYNEGYTDAERDISDVLKANPDKYIAILKKLKECK